MDTEICHLGYSIRKDTLPSHFLENIRRDLYVKPVENPSFPTNTPAYPIFRISKNKVYLPRYYGITEYGPAKKNALTNEGENIDVEFVGSLRPMQENVIEETVKIYNLYGAGLISLDTGLGKTVVALKLVSLMKKKTLVIVHAEFLLEQWVERIKTFLPTARIGIIQQNKCDWESKDIVVGMLQSIIKRDYPPECFKSFGSMTIDESHHICSRTFSSIFFKVQTKYMLGLSATPERKDGLSKVIYWFLGPQIVNIKRDINKPKIRFIVNDCSDYEEKLNKIGKINNPIMITDITLSSTRNELIMEIIKEYLKESRKILILSDRRAHCEYINSECKKSGISSGVYLGGMKTEARNLTVECSVIIGTYQASGEGFDVPSLDTLILATPKSDTRQAVGRILRQKNKNDPIVIDIVDPFSIFKGQYYKRKKFYKTCNFELIK